MREFVGDDLEQINRVIVDVGNPLARTTAGRLEIANNMMQMGLIKTPQEYLSVLNTGRLEVMYQADQLELLQLRDENESLMRGEQVRVLLTDTHKDHILEHRAILADPQMRKDEKLVAAVLDHIQEHINVWRDTSPDILMSLGQQPLAPQQPPAPEQQGPGPMPGGPALDPGAINDPNQMNLPPQIQEQMADGQVRMPNIPSPPGQFADLPTNPADVR
jgi:hypothetical protein